MPDAFCNHIIQIMAMAGDAIIEIYNKKDFGTEIKTDNSPVTLADKASAEIINSSFSALCPEIPIINEEQSIPDYDVRKLWNKYFMVDPLDGTKEFIARNGEFCINIALMNGIHPLEGWIYQPITGTGLWCRKGDGVYGFNRDGRYHRIVHSEYTSKILRIAISRSFSNNYEKRILATIAETHSTEIHIKGSSIKQINIVQGLSDLYIKAGKCSEWDTAPGQLMIEEIGGAVLTLEKFEKMTYNKPQLINPQFVMIAPRLNNNEFISYLKQVIHS
jgi:3'(2'), 5'-bisphosphate nucleotidase